MKEFLLFAFIQVSVLLFAQKYHFDTLLEYNYNSKYCENCTSYSLRNSKNGNAHLEISKNYITHEFYGILIDKENMVVHRFSIPNFDFNKDIKFVYQNSNATGDRVLYKYDNIEVKKVDDMNFVITTVSKKRGNRVEDLKLSIELMNFERDLLFVDYEPLTSKEELYIIDLLKRQLNFSDGKNYIIKGIYVNENSHGISIKQILKKIQNVDYNFDVSLKK